ncbi:hypothetical protein VN24_04410 [Paenibacillus beijingensis]|uniref:DUF2269 family protein n=1 Tax=Paenibacillus beijingensis TaxID=1126833 RepID=A0A0D5NQA2_9BACL|nr:hypothetical protein VN24_04410 [Paenibacillus beijingensis]
MLEWLVLLHVMTAVLGLGPAYAFPFILRDASFAPEMEKTLGLVARLEMFPKIFGTLAVVSGLVLFWIGSYGSFTQLWILGTLILYVIIEVLIVGFLNPTVSKLQASLQALDMTGNSELPAHVKQMYAKVRNLHLWASVLSLIIFIFMILKPG